MNEYFLYKHEELSSYAQKSHEQLGAPVIPALLEWRGVSSRFRERPCPRNLKQRVLEIDAQQHASASTCAHKYPQHVSIQHKYTKISPRKE